APPLATPQALSCARCRASSSGVAPVLRRPGWGGCTEGRAGRPGPRWGGRRTPRPCPSRQYRVSVERTSSACVETERLAPLGQGDDVVQLFEAGFKKAAGIARGFTDAPLVFDQRDPHVSFALFAQTHAP